MMRAVVILGAFLLMAQAPVSTQEKQLEQRNDQLVAKLQTMQSHVKGRLPPVLEDRAMEPHHDAVERLKRANASLEQQLKEANQQGYH